MKLFSGKKKGEDAQAPAPVSAPSPVGPDGEPSAGTPLASRGETASQSPTVSGDSKPKKKWSLGKNDKLSGDSASEQSQSQTHSAASHVASEPKESRKGFFGGKKEDRHVPQVEPVELAEKAKTAEVFAHEKRELTPEEKAAVEEYSRKKTKKLKKGGGFSLFKKAKLVDTEPAPTAITSIPGKLVDDPTYALLQEYKNITYPVKEPFQFVNIVHENGETTYNVIQPQLTTKEQNILKSIKKTYDMLVNSERVLVDTTDKIEFVNEIYKEILDIQGVKLSPLERQRILYYLLRDYVGFGEIDALMNDRMIEDISCNGPDTPLYVYHRVYESIKTNVVFEEMALNSLLLRLAQISGRHISILQPIRDAALPDGSRINMTMGREVTKKGATFTIRKFRSRPISPVELIRLNSVDTRIFSYLWLLVEFGSSILISGGTAAGKTTLLNGISMLIKQENKIVSIEDTPEINLAHTNWIQAITRIGFGEASSSSNVSGISGVSGKGRSAGDVSLFDLLVAALRQRPEYLIVGEVRGEEAYTLFQAISVGHSAMGTIHAASMSELLARVESPPMNVPRVLLSNTNLVIFVNAVRKGTEKVRRVREIVEILGLDPETKELVTNVVFRWDPFTDTFEYGGRSFLLEKIADKLGLEKRQLYEQLEKRASIFEYLISKSVSDYREVSDIIRNYYKDPAGILNAIQVKQV
ncbi:MAG: type II/IV secretion system ATPase subunit [Nitrososphaera sp.]|jgi:flagellar protein FlaI